MSYWYEVFITAKKFPLGLGTDVWIYFYWIVIFFSIDLSVEEGGGSLELIPGGRDIEVTASNVYDYVRKYAEYRMYKAQYKALEVSI